MEKSTNSPDSKIPSRIHISDGDFLKTSKDDLLKRWRENESYIDYVEQSTESKDVEEKLKLQQQESARRENVLVMRLTAKEQEMQDLLAQIQELKQPQTPSATQLQNMLIDPAVNVLFEKMKTEVTDTKDKLEQAQNDLSAWKFTPDSVTGKKLMAKCRMLIQENQDLGKQLSQGRIAQLEAELALQKKYSDELKESQDEMNEFVVQLDEEVEGMQATICTLQQQLKEEKTRSENLESKNEELQRKLQEISTHFQSNTSPLDSNTRTVECEVVTSETIDEPMNNYDISKSPAIPINPAIENFVEDSNDSLTNQADELNDYDDERTCSPVIPNHTETIVKTEMNDQMEVDHPVHRDFDQSAHRDLSHTSNNHLMLRTSEDLDLKPIPNQHKKQFSTNENQNELLHTTQQRISPNKSNTKTSFSITDLLSDTKEVIRKDTMDVSMDVALGLKTEENGTENGALNGEIDDTAI